MFKKIKKEEISVLFVITNLNVDGWNYFKLDSKEYS
jgi:hypothetical protein